MKSAEELADAMKFVLPGEEVAFIRRVQADAIEAACEKTQNYKLSPASVEWNAALDMAHNGILALKPEAT